MKKVITLLSLATLISVATFSCKKDDPKTDDPSNNTSTEKKYALVIDNGAQTMEAGQTLALKAHLVSTSGEVISVSGVSWSSNIGTVTGANFSATSESSGSISASVTYEGVTYTAAVPISVQPPAGTLLFGVVPSAIIWSTNSGPIQLNTVYIGSQNASFAFSSDAADIASVSSAGLVTFNKVGNTTVKVTATIGGQKSTINVPIMVVGEPEVPLPVTRIVVNPTLGELFRGETLQMNAKAYNSKGEDVTSTVTFNYAVQEKLEDNEEPSNPIKIDASGKVTAQSIGDAYVKVTANGILGQAEITVNPDTIITVNPFFVNFGMDITQFPPVPGPSEQVLTAKMQKVDRAKYRAKDPSFLVDLPTPSNLQWMLPQTGIPQIDDIFKVVTLSDATTTSVKVKPIANKIGSTVVIAHAGIYGGAASISVNP
jgi:uncharacterized protein YxeA